jgi:hypothetical protein
MGRVAERKAAFGAEDGEYLGMCGRVRQRGGAVRRGDQHQRIADGRDPAGGQDQIAFGQVVGPVGTGECHDVGWRSGLDLTGQGRGGGEREDNLDICFL